MKLVSRLKVLLAEKEVHEGRTISLREIARETGVPHSTVFGMANNTMKEIPVEGIVALCAYLDCDISDLLQLVGRSGGDDATIENNIEALESVAA